MTQLTKEQLEEMYGDDVLDQLAFIAGCHRDSLSNDETIPNGWIISDKTLRKYAELIVLECMKVASPNYMSTPEDSVYYVEEAIGSIAKHFGIDGQQDEIKFCPLCGEEWSGTSCGLDDCGWILNERTNF